MSQLNDCIVTIVKWIEMELLKPRKKREIRGTNRYGVTCHFLQLFDRAACDRFPNNVRKNVFILRLSSTAFWANLRIQSWEKKSVGNTLAHDHKNAGSLFHECWTLLNNNESNGIHCSSRENTWFSFAIIKKRNKKSKKPETWNMFIGNERYHILHVCTHMDMNHMQPS